MTKEEHKQRPAPVMGGESGSVRRSTTMLFADLTANGVLVIRAFSPVIPSDTSHPSSMKAKCAMCGIILMKNETSVCRVCARRIEKAK